VPQSSRLCLPNSKKQLSSPSGGDESDAKYHAFLSFSHDDAAVADSVAQALKVQTPDIRLFDYRLSIDVGKAWQDEIDRAIGACLKMVALLSPSYFSSDVCRESWVWAGCSTDGETNRSCF
jgi:TIR domain-containing protein